MQVVVAPPALTVVQQVVPAVPAATQALSGDASKPLLGAVEGAAAQAVPAVKQEAAQVLHDHAQHLAVQASGTKWLHARVINAALKSLHLIMEHY